MTFERLFSDIKAIIEKLSYNKTIVFKNISDIGSEMA